MARPRLGLETKSVKLRKGTTEEIKRYYPNLGYSGVLRFLIEEHLKGLRAQEQALSAGGATIPLPSFTKEDIERAASSADYQ